MHIVARSAQSPSKWWLRSLESIQLDHLSSESFGIQDFNLVLQLDFYASGNGKGLVDGVGGVFRRGYWSECTKSLKGNARKVNKIAEWVESDFHQFDSAVKDSRQKVNISFSDLQKFSITVLHSISFISETPTPKPSNSVDPSSLLDPQCQNFSAIDSISKHGESKCAFQKPYNFCKVSRCTVTFYILSGVCRV